MDVMKKCSVLGLSVNELSYEAILTWIKQRSGGGTSHYMCISTVHMVMEGFDNPEFQEIVNQADLVGADGMPVIWASRALGLSNQTRVFAPDLVLRVCEIAAANGINVGFYGSTQEVLDGLTQNLVARFPQLRIAFSYSPPFRPLTRAEDEDLVEKINDAGVHVLFVGLGCPKQERWMNAHRPSVKATMLGVGWAFDVVAGRSKAAPYWIQNIGMEWFYRLLLNPRKLWRRHFKNNPRFIILILLQLCGLIRYPHPGLPKGQGS
jgi:N-acetylglucosaminyldiphosphoundecaprenol N-acetyl-beta-D-mannosaminyltransferase